MKRQQKIKIILNTEVDLVASLQLFFKVTVTKIVKTKNQMLRSFFFFSGYGKCIITLTHQNECAQLAISYTMDTNEIKKKIIISQFFFLFNLYFVVSGILQLIYVATMLIFLFSIFTHHFQKVKIIIAIKNRREKNICYFTTFYKSFRNDLY